MKKSLVIFGSGDIAELAHHYFSADSNYKVVAFTVDSAFMKSKEFCHLPVVPFEEVVHHYSPDSHEIFIALSYSRLNQIRKEKYFAAKKLGYQCASYISSRSTILNNNVIGDNCFIFEDNTIQPFVKIGNNITLWSGNHIGHHSVLHDHSFISSHVVISGGVEVGESCFIGVNATLRDHIKVGEKSVIGAGTLILSDTEAESLYIGSATQPSPISSTKLKKI